MMHRWLSGNTDQSGVAGHLQSDHIHSKSNSYHGEPYIPADVFNVSIYLYGHVTIYLADASDYAMLDCRWPALTRCFIALWSSFSANDLN